MVEDPVTDVVVRASDRTDATGDFDAEVVERAGRIAKEIVRNEPRAGCVHARVVSSAGLHSGLGTGTQLSLAIAKGIDLLSGRNRPSVELAAAAGRGERSAIGIHGFERGGFLVDGGRPPSGAIAPLVVRVEFPAAWPILLIRPTVPTGLSGDVERSAFAQSVEIPQATTDRLTRLILLGMLPAIAERDHHAFSHALIEYNHTVGECFAFAQGGAYAHPRLAEIVAAIRQLDVAGVGQSSWGPTLFAIAPDAEKGAWLRSRVKAMLNPGDECIETRARNAGAEWTCE